MALHYSYSFSVRHYHLRHLFASRNPRFAVKCQNSQIETETTENPRKSSSSGVGFGSFSPSSAPAKKGKRKGKREVIMHPHVDKPVFISEQGAAKAAELRRNENTFLLTWLGLGGVILIQGIILAASGTGS